MKTWMIGGLLVAIAGTAYYVARKPDAQPPAPVVEASPVPDAPAVPVVLPDVVNVTNIDALLDPPQIPVADSDAPPTAVVVDFAADHVPAIRPTLPLTIPAAAE